MATIFKKTGFWMFEKTTSHLVCDRCRKELIDDNIFMDNVNPGGSTKRYCRGCALSIGLSLEPHDWPCDADILDPDGPELLYHALLNKSDGQTKYIKHCFQCNTLLAATIHGAKINKIYYVVGSKTPTNTQPNCTRVKIDYVGGHNKVQLNCHHNFIEVANSRTRKDVERGFSGSFGDVHKVTKVSETVDSGLRCIWCSNCGLFFKLPIYRAGELKLVGINTDWYN